MKIYQWLTFILLLSSCGPAAMLKRAEKLIAKAESQGAKVKIDTVFITKEIIVPETHFDTVLRQVNFRDTITIIKDKVITRVKINTVSKEIFVETKCPEKKEIVKVPYTVVRKISAGYTLWQLIILGLVGLATGYGVRAFMKR